MDCDIAIINEHWLLEDELVYYNPKGYQIAASYCRNKDPQRGVAIFVRKNIEFKVVDVSKYCHVVLFKLTAVLVEFCNIIVVSLNSTPQSNVTLFLNTLGDLLSYLMLYKQKNGIVLGGYLNFDLNNECDNNVTLLQFFLSLLACIIQITLPLEKLHV